MQILQYSFCCGAHIFRTLKEKTTRQSKRSDIMFEVLKARYAKWQRYSRTVSELEALSNRDLADLGIARGDINRIARQAARG